MVQKARFFQSRREPKGQSVKIPIVGQGAERQRVQTRRRLPGPREELSFLFNTALAPEMGLALDRGGRVAERLTSSAVRCAQDAP